MPAVQAHQTLNISPLKKEVAMAKTKDRLVTQVIAKEPTMQGDILNIQSELKNIKEKASSNLVLDVKKSFDTQNEEAVAFLPAATATLSGAVSHDLTPYPALNGTIGAATGVAVGYVLNVVGVATPVSMVTGAISGFKCSYTFD